ncbi:MAG: alpha-amylase family glycosyl hydrolase, partial [Bacteroidota bacterium]
MKTPFSSQSPTRGTHYPLGPSITGDGVNFCLFARHADRVELVLFDRADATTASRVYPLDPRQHKTYHYWHIFIPGLSAGQVYGWRVHGPFDPSHGHRFDGQKLLVDPYARALVVPQTYNRRKSSIQGDNTDSAIRSVVVDMNEYDWEGDQPLELPFRKTIIYEMHVKGFTMHDSSGVSEDKRGTYAGLIEKIPYLKDLGITAVELMPVFHFDEQDAPMGLTNYWGYTPFSFFAPHTHFSSDKGVMGPLNEFRDMVKALHRAGIEVILDVVYNHTSEGNHEGPTISLKGLANTTYYHLQHDPRFYDDYSGTGNTLSANHAVVRRLIIDSLKFWVTEMHVDGFR